ncbi:MAG TPA: hypothetical protein IAA57_03265 [Candidatus Pullilachnospira intestinigallinarum]|nr:hypothetical protein [Candidatus Pullilachnospira intestinigallinarum]
MLDEKKIRLMTKIARYEQNEGKEDLRIAGYYRSDFIASALLKNFVLTTVGYAAVVILYLASRGDSFLEELEFVHLIMMAVVIAAGYLIALVCYSGAVYILESLRYSRAQKDVRAYDAWLVSLEKLYGNEKEGNTGERRAKPKSRRRKA